ncbi:aminotransferase class V-fold PLP-dependent enzyme [uncultured Imperialibacter sp.]|uniref:aminotransferase class V-fold PLP-dependent enzyme n=1 Tax=uncultured Imperialibacter sp. TaxID=1672639 RepID=UPI0030DC9742
MIADKKGIRSQYPLLHNCTYLNTANAGAMSQATLQKGTDYLTEFAQYASQKLPVWMAEMEETRKLFAELLNASSEEIGLTWDTSYGISWVQQMLPSDLELVLVKHDFPSVTLPWIHHSRKIHWIDWDMKSHIDLEAIEKVLSGKPKVLVISHVQYTNGYRIDLEAISAMCQKHGTFLIVDAIQSLGVIPIDLQKIHVDVLAASSYKWLTAGYGAGMIYVNKHSTKRLQQGALGPGSMTDFLKDPIPAENLKNPPQSLEAGHPKPLLILMQGQALKELKAIGWQNIYEEVKALSTKLHTAIIGAGFTPMAPRDEKSWSGIVSFECDKSLHQKLTDEKIITTYRPNYLRAAVHFYNEEGEIAQLKSLLNPAST